MKETITAKGKAIELINTYRKNKECAMICVEQLIKEHTWESPISWNVKRLAFWNAVKSELELQT